MTTFDDFEETEEYDEELEELYGVRDGVLFIIDATPSMFQNDDNEGIPYFLQCIRQYKEILKQKLVWNRQDWMGLIFFGTDKHDDNSEIKHILTVQKLSLVSVDHLKEAMSIDEGEKWKDYQTAATASSYPLHDVLWHAARMFSSINVTMPSRRVVLFTCQDDPPLTDNNEKHRIRVKVSSYVDTDLHLTVIGLGNSWNHEIFYKDLEIVSEKIDSEDYKRPSLKDLLRQVKLPSRSMAKLPWRLGEGVIIDVEFQNVSVKGKYLQTESISKEANTPLTSHRQLTLAHDNIDHEEGERLSPVMETDITKYVDYGGREICFTSGEIKSFDTIKKPGIDTICVKPIFYHPLYHVNAPYYVIPSKSYRKDNKLLFSALLHKCDLRNLMIVCAVTLREHSSSKLYTMVPNTKNGGFYLYKIAFRENIRRMNKHLANYIYDDEKKPPINPNGVEVLKEMMPKLKSVYDPQMFLNPQLQMQLQIIETLALDLEEKDPPPDTTIPILEGKKGEVEELLSKYNEIFNYVLLNAPPTKKVKETQETTVMEADLEEIQEIVREGNLQCYTIPQLKELLKKLNLKLSGKKDELILRIKEYCE